MEARLDLPLARPPIVGGEERCRLKRATRLFDRETGKPEVASDGLPE